MGAPLRTTGVAATLEIQFFGVVYRHERFRHFVTLPFSFR